MDPTYPDDQFEESHSQTHRSGTGSGVPTTEGLFQLLNLVEAPPETSGATSYPSSRLEASKGEDASVYTTSAVPTAAVFSSTSSSHPYLPLTPVPDSVPDARWFQPSQPATAATPPIRVPIPRTESVPSQPQHQRSSTTSPCTSQRAIMRYVSRGRHPRGGRALTQVPVRLPYNTIRRSTWPGDRRSTGQS